MTSLLPEEESNVTRLKQKSQSNGSRSTQPKPGMDEARSFLDFSRENLSISSADLEQGFNKPSRFSGSRYCCSCGVSRQTLLSCAALVLALSCAGMELWKLRRAVVNAREIEALRRDVETLKHRFLERDLFDELKAFEEQLYGDGPGDDEELLTNPASDYDSSYDDADESSSTLSPNDHHESTTPASTGMTTTTRSTAPCTRKELEDVLTVLRRAEAERGQYFERNRLLEEERAKERRRISEEHAERSKRGVNRTWRRDFFTRLKRPPKE